jgi:hypothetical protein
VRRLALLVAVVLAGCGGSQQGADEPRGEFRVEIVGASFPRVQHIADSVQLKLRVRNGEAQDTLRNVAVTVETEPKTRGDAAIAFGQQERGAGLASAGRPVWVLDEGPKGGTTAYDNTWLAGELFPSQTKELTWKLVAVKAGTYTLRYRVAPGLTGRGTAAGGRSSGEIHVRIIDEPVPARVGENRKVERGVEPGN